MRDGRVRVHGVNISYFTGKLEAYLRYKEIPYDLVPGRPGQMRKRAGAAQVPVVELPDGRFITDTTLIIRWFEEEHRDSPVVLSADSGFKTVKRMLLTRLFAIPQVNPA